MSLKPRGRFASPARAGQAPRTRAGQPRTAKSRSSRSEVVQKSAITRAGNCERTGTPAATIRAWGIASRGGWRSLGATSCGGRRPMPMRGKLLYVNAGHRLSLQFHREKDETSYVLSGRLRLILWTSAEDLREEEVASRTRHPGRGARRRPYDRGDRGFGGDRGPRRRSSMTWCALRTATGARSPALRFSAWWSW